MDFTSAKDLSIQITPDTRIYCEYEFKMNGTGMGGIKANGDEVVLTIEGEQMELEVLKNEILGSYTINPDGIVELKIKTDGSVAVTYSQPDGSPVSMSGEVEYNVFKRTLDLSLTATITDDYGSSVELKFGTEKIIRPPLDSTPKPTTNEKKDQSNSENGKNKGTNKNLGGYTMQPLNPQLTLEQINSGQTLSGTNIYQERNSGRGMVGLTAALAGAIAVLSQLGIRRKFT